MKFTCTKENFSHALQLVGGVASRHAHLPILSHVLIHAKESNVEVVATNLEVGIRVTVRAKVEVAGSFTVPAKTISDYVSLLKSEQMSVALEDHELVITSGSSKTKIKGVGAEEFPILPEIDEKHGYVAQAAELRRQLGRVSIAAAKNEIRPELSGVYWSFRGERYDGLLLAATDSYRLAESRCQLIQGADQLSCIVPGRTVLEMIRLLSFGSQGDREQTVRLWVSDNQVAVRYENIELTSRLVDGRYPDYAQIIPANYRSVAAFPDDVMVNNIKAASLFTTSGVNAVSFVFQPQDHVLKVSSMSSQAGEHTSSIDAEVVGEENSIVLNHRYVLEGLQQMDGDIEFRVNSHEAPCVFAEKEKSDYLYIVMPIRQ